MNRNRDVERRAYDIDGRMGKRLVAYAAGHPRSVELMALPAVAHPGLVTGVGVAWDHYAAALNALADALGEEFLVESMATEVFGANDFALVVGAMGTLTTPERLFRFFMGVGGRLNPGVESSLQRPSPGHLQIRLVQPHADAVPCRVYFLLTKRVFELLPATMLGTREAVVRCQTDGLQASFDIQLPPSRSVWAWMRNLWHALIGRGAMAELVYDEQVRAQEQMVELQRVSDELEERVSARTQELALLNERLRAVSANKSRHLADMSHELRTPLNAIIGYAQMLAEDAVEDGSSTTADLHRIDTAAHYLLRLIDNVLDLSKIEAGQLEVLHSTIELGPVVAETVESLRAVLEGPGNRVVVELGPAWCHADSTRVQQIVANLLGNAAKFCSDGEIHVRCSTREGVVVVTVEDTGCGMPSEETIRIFEPYQQGASAGDGAFQGTGLGLPISRELARLMDGTLDATSTVGVGSVFTLRLPSAPPPE